MARRRVLRPEEEELWRAVARTARAMHVTGGVFLKPVEPVLHPAPQTNETAHAQPALRMPLFRLGEKSRDAPGHTKAHGAMPLAALQMDAKTHTRMTRGKLTPDARIDLHGMTLAEAHPELIGFILRAQSAGLRLALVITGKGKHGLDSGPIPQRMGVLRHQVPIWLRLPPIGTAVLQVAEAHLRHGGSGAFYVYLRRGHKAP